MGEEGGREREKKNLFCEYGGFFMQVCGCDVDFVIKFVVYGVWFMMICRFIVLILKEKIVFDFLQSEFVFVVLE